MTNESGVGTDPERLFLCQAAALKIRQAQHEEPRNPREFLAAGRQPCSFSLPLDEFDAKEILQLLDLPAVLALPDRVPIGGLHDAAGGAHLQQRFQAVQRKPAFGKEF